MSRGVTFNHLVNGGGGPPETSITDFTTGASPQLAVVAGDVLTVPVFFWPVAPSIGDPWTFFPPPTFLGLGPGALGWGTAGGVVVA